VKCSSILSAAALALAATPAALAQSASYTPPKTSWGAPDLQGFFSSASLTTITRPAGASGLIVSDEEAAKLFRGNIYTRVANEEAEHERAVTSGEKKQTLLTDANPDRAYNRYWMDPGADLGKIDGKYRSSWIVEPANGQIPYLTVQTGRNALVSASSEEEFSDLGSDNPEDRGIPERCIWGFTGGPGPVLFNAMYNNNYQIVQTPTEVMIMAEMNHDVRVIKIGGTLNPSGIAKWGGDSVGHYEGNTLVVETRNVEPKQKSYISPQGKVTERFTRVNEGQILYEYTIEDSSRYSQPWKGQMPLNASHLPPYEYACHEGNYSMFNLLNGARVMEKEGRKNGSRKAIFAGIPEAE